MGRAQERAAAVADEGCMIADGRREPCFQCSTVFEFCGGFIVDARWADEPCLGCVRWFEMLEAARLAASAHTADPEPAAEPMDLSPSAILSRLLAGRRPKETRDHAKAAAGDID